MDPLTQGVLGAGFPQSVASKKDLRTAAVVGFLSGMMADLDVFIRSSEDPLLFLEYHRQFTHSLIFIPIGGLIAALILFGFFKRQHSFGSIYLFACLGYGTHALLDACTTYGTQLFWPFTDYRVAWNFISIIDPLFTLPLLVLVIVSFKKRSKLWARLAVLWSVFYMTLGWIQYERAVAQSYQIAQERGHTPINLSAKPSFANILLWKTVYETQDGDETVFYVDAVRVGFKVKRFMGESIKKFNLKRDLPGLDASSQQAKDIQRFSWFSNGYIALLPGQPNVIGDIRYSILPNKIDPLWGIRVDSDQSEKHVKYETFRNLISRREFFKMLGF